ncbi:MAG TPA: polysaccharide deacetylase family protein [Firmicutes bacterium]|nr:polysaccharide deacetylase family protein [Bacillota bacterium]
MYNIGLILEIRSFRCNGNNFYLAVNAHNNGKIAPFEVPLDKQTYLELSNKITFGNGSLFRLSLQSLWDPYRKQHLAKVTKLAGEQRESIYFICTKAFVQTLQQLQGKEFLQQLNSQGNAETTLPASLAVSRQKKQKLIALGHWQKVKRAACIAFLLLVFIRLGNAYSNNRGVEYAAGQNMPIVYDETPAPEDKQENENIQVNENTQENDETATEQNQFSVPVERMSQTNVAEGCVALTFDDGPTLYTEAIVDVLREKQVAATFFLVGKNIEAYPEKVAYLVNAKMSIGNHSWSHRDLTQLSPSSLVTEIEQPNELLMKLTQTTPALFRSPYGTKNQTLLQELEKRQMKLMLWNRDPQDWNDKSPEDILTYFAQTEPSGGVYVLHETKATLEALPQIIDLLKEKGLKIVTLH